MEKAHITIASRRFAADLRRSFEHLIHSQSVSGMLLIICAVIAMVFANVPALRHIPEIWHTPIALTAGDFKLEMSLLHWVNDALMAIFFFVVGLEIKREMMVGELRSFRKAALPIFAAVGGMIVPALIYLFFNHGQETVSGWGIPMATDIAFALGVLSLLGDRVPLGLKVFLTALAIVDDLGAIIVLAIFYPSHALHLDFLIYAGIVVVVLLAINRSGLRHPLYYLIPGIFLWYFVYRSGIHATISGVILALTIPAKTTINEVRFNVRMRYFLQRFRGTCTGEVNVLADAEQQMLLHRMERNIREISPLMHRFESALHPWVNFFIMPVFALANAGVLMDGSVIASGNIPPLVPGIFFGLLLGKPIGIFLMSFLAVKLRLADLPMGSRWMQIFAIGMVGGIGFTMSIFVDNLAFTLPRYVELGKAAILITSVVAAILGLIVVGLTTRKNKETIIENNQ